MTQKFLCTLGVALQACLFSYAAGSAPSNSPEALYVADGCTNDLQYVTWGILNDIEETIHFAAKNEYRKGDVVVNDCTDFSKGECPETASFRVQSPAYQERLEIPDLWAAQVYAPFAQAVLKREGVQAKVGARTYSHRDLLERLSCPLASVLAEVNAALSKDLTQSPADPELHEQAALLLATFGLRDEAGDAFNPVHAMSRACSHLAVASALSGEKSSVSGKIAAAVLHTLAGNQRKAEVCLNTLPQEPQVDVWARVLRVRPTVPVIYRDRARGNPAALAAKVETRTLLERLEFFRASSRTSLPAAVGKGSQSSLIRDERERAACDWYLIAATKGGSVTERRWNLSLATRLLMEFAQAIGEKEAHGRLAKQFTDAGSAGTEESLCAPSGADAERLLKLLNTPPSRLVNADGLQVLSKGLWADFYQRAYMFASDTAFYSLHAFLGLRDEAKDFRGRFKASSSGLRCFPFFLWNANPRPDELPAIYRAAKASIDSAPHLVPPGHIQQLYVAAVMGKKGLAPNGLPYDAWFCHIAPPGVASRFYGVCGDPKQQIALNRRFLSMSPHFRLASDELMEALHGKDPVDLPLSAYQELYGPRLEYDPDLLVKVAENCFGNDPLKYTETMLKAAEINPQHYRALGTRTLASDKDKGVEYLRKFYDLHDNSVARAAVGAVLIRDSLDRGNAAEAKRIASFCGDVYSVEGLFSLAYFEERSGNQSAALKTYKAIADRYEGSDGALRCFCYRNRGAGIPESEVKAAEVYLEKVFAGKPVPYKAQTEPPRAGARVAKASGLSKAWGLDVGDVIVAQEGIATKNSGEAAFMRLWKPDPEMELVVYKKGGYRTIKVLLTGRRFGNELEDLP